MFGGGGGTGRIAGVFGCMQQKVNQIGVCFSHITRNPDVGTRAGVVAPRC